MCALTCEFVEGELSEYCCSGDMLFGNVVGDLFDDLGIPIVKPPKPWWFLN